MKIDSFISKENNIFYLDIESYNEDNNDIPFERGDVIKFNYNNQKYIGKLVEICLKNGLMKIQLC